MKDRLNKKLVDDIDEEHNVNVNVKNNNYLMRAYMATESKLKGGY
jgi:hypothetical protein